MKKLSIQELKDKGLYPLSEKARSALDIDVFLLTVEDFEKIGYDHSRDLLKEVDSFLIEMDPPFLSSIDQDGVVKIGSFSTGFFMKASEEMCIKMLQSMIDADLFDPSKTVNEILRNKRGSIRYDI